MDDAELATALRTLAAPVDPPADARTRVLHAVRHRGQRRLGSVIAVGAAAVTAGTVALVPLVGSDGPTGRAPATAPPPVTSGPDRTGEQPVPAGTPGLDPYPTDRQIRIGSGGWRLANPGDRRASVPLGAVLPDWRDGQPPAHTRLRVATAPDYRRATGTRVIDHRLVWVVMQPGATAFVSGPFIPGEADRPDPGLTTSVWLYDARSGRELFGTQVFAYGQSDPAVVDWPDDPRYPRLDDLASAGIDAAPVGRRLVGITEENAVGVVGGDVIVQDGDPRTQGAPTIGRLRAVTIQGTDIEDRRAWLVLTPRWPMVDGAVTVVTVVDAYTGDRLARRVVSSSS